MSNKEESFWLRENGQLMSLAIISLSTHLLEVFLRDNFLSLSLASYESNNSKDEFSFT